jgi:2-polyprenyl-3-methyl-5-hydroxy-6-metoxy-1,4-benzoquinol methylase
MECIEKQYNGLGATEDHKAASLPGHRVNGTWNLDPKRLVFTLARYKFAAKMLEGKSDVLEIGCGDGFASRIVRQHVQKLTISAFDPRFVSEASLHDHPKWSMNARVINPLAEPVQGFFDGVYLLDVLEHIKPEDENLFLSNIVSGLSPDAIMVVGMPSRESQIYASEASRIGHVNCKTSEDLKSKMKEYFNNVFSFSMNDEVVHTGFARMANYIFAVPVPDNAE